MTKSRTNIEEAAGQLISAVQKEWGAELGESQAVASEDVLDNAHELLQAAKAGNLVEFLNGRTVAEFMGELWLERHPSIKAAVSFLEAQLGISGNV